MSFVDVAPDLRHRIVRITGLSKSYAMTGWRVGFGIAPAETTAAMTRLQSHSTSNVCTIVQKAALAAFDCRDEVETMRQAFHRRRDVLVAGLRGAGINAPAPDATLYVWFPVPEGRTSSGFAKELLETAGIVATPGNGFGASGEGYVRMTLCLPEARLTEAVERIQQAGLV